MGKTEDSSANQSQALTTQRGRANLVIAPKDYFLGPVFAATPQTGAREVTIGERRYLVGGFDPMDSDAHPPALDVRHARAIFSLLSFRDPFDDTLLVRFSFNEFCRRYAQSNGGRYARAIKRVLNDLVKSYIQITNTRTGISHSYRLIERVDIEGHPIRRRDAKLAKKPYQQELWFNGCTLSPEFAGLLGNIAELQHLKLDVFTSIRSPLAQAIYLYIPSRAHHHDADKPFEITLTKLMEQVSFPISQYKSVRRKTFNQHEESGRSIIQQLEGLETLSGHFHVTLAETEDGSDWKLQAWVTKTAPKRKLDGQNSKLVAAYLKSGRPPEYLDQALSNVGPLSAYEEELLERADVEINGNRRFFEMAKAILKDIRFRGLLSEAKGDMIEGRAARTNPTARLIYRIMESISTPAQPQPKR